MSTATNMPTNTDTITDAEYQEIKARIEKNAKWVDGLRKKRKCARCKGTGQIPYHNKVHCVKCDGVGYMLGPASYRVEDMPCDIPRVSNEDRGKVEVYEFVRDKPSRYFAYVQFHAGATLRRVASGWELPTDVEQSSYVVTSSGDVLGIITWIGAEYHVRGFGGHENTRQNLRIVGVNGVVYSAVYFKSSGDYCRMKAFKNVGENEVSK